MKILILAFLFPVLAHCAEPDITKIPWPKAICDFPDGEKITFTSGGYQISRRTPEDPQVQAAGGTGGPMVEFTLKEIKGGWKTTLVEQSVGERLLEDYKGKPQIEIWSRGGGGYWTRRLYRYGTTEYSLVRIDEFEESPRHGNEKAITTEMPPARRGKGDQQSDKLYFVETRLP